MATTLSRFIIWQRLRLNSFFGNGFVKLITITITITIAITFTTVISLFVPHAAVWGAPRLKQQRNKTNANNTVNNNKQLTILCPTCKTATNSVTQPDAAAPRHCSCTVLLSFQQPTFQQLTTEVATVCKHIIKYMQTTQLTIKTNS